jgi:cysteinyl-tRNA synthetase
MPQALAVVHETMRDGNNAMASGDTAALGAALTQVRAMLGVLGLDPLSEKWGAPSADHDLRDVVDALVGVAAEQRQAARDRKDWRRRTRSGTGCRPPGSSSRTPRTAPDGPSSDDPAHD